MNVSLTPELEKFVNAKVETGRYNSASEVVREALRLLEEHDKTRAEFHDELGRRLAAIDSGKFITGTELRERFRERLEPLKKSTNG